VRAARPAGLSVWSSASWEIPFHIRLANAWRTVVEAQPSKRSRLWARTLWAMKMHSAQGAFPELCSDKSPTRMGPPHENWMTPGRRAQENATILRLKADYHKVKVPYPPLAFGRHVRVVGIGPDCHRLEDAGRGFVATALARTRTGRLRCGVPRPNQ
jgi:hypothetical protein